MGSPSTRIWRTVVFAGAMLATPLGGCGSPSQKPVAKPTAESPPPAAADDERLAAQRAEEQRVAAEQAQAAEDQRLAEEARVAEEQRKADEERAAQERQRARGSASPEDLPISRKPRGRGFVLG